MMFTTRYTLVDAESCKEFRALAGTSGSEKQSSRYKFARLGVFLCKTIMNERTDHKMAPQGKRPRLIVWTVVILSVLVIFLALKNRRRAVDAVRENSDAKSPPAVSSTVSPPANPFARSRPRMERLGSELPPEQAVAVRTQSPGGRGSVREERG
jgi:hypothetical protein